MANTDGRRAVINDPLAANAAAQRPDRSLQLSGVHAPHTPSPASLTTQDGVTQAMQGVEGILAQELEKKKDEWITEGKVAYQSGVTEQAMLASGNAFTAQGYRTLQARDTVNTWFTEQTIAIDETTKKIDPQEYAAQLKQQRANVLNGISDPSAKKVAAAAFEDMSPRLAQAHAIKNNEYNRIERVNAFSSTLYSTGPTSATASKREPGEPLAMSPVPVGPVLQPSARDRDIGIRTMLGEAANEGAEGLAAVAHVLKNRTTDGRWPDSIAGVALQPKQFSTHNAGAGGNGGGSQYPIGSQIYERAGQVFDAVMSGKHVDPTGGATHYYSPAGMQALVAEGSQPNVVPKWLDEETARGGGRIKIGGHIFVGKSSDAVPREGKSYDTQLSPAEEKNFQTWKATNAPNDSGADYDLRGAFKAGVQPAANGHWPDTYKKPNHPTFSDQSQYAVGADKAKAGSWKGETFTPAPQVTATTIGSGTPGDINAVPSKEGVGVTGVAQAAGSNEVQQLINGYSGLNKEDKATAVADAMRRGLDAGNDTLFRDAGGVSVLHRLGAKPGEVDEVLKARKRYDDKQQTEFSVARETYRNDIMKRAEDGEALPSILADIDAKHKAGFMNDMNARALASSAADKIRAQSGDKSKLANPDMLNELGGLYQQIATGGDFKTLAAQGKKIADKYGATEKDVQHIVGKMFSDSQQYQNNFRTKVEAAAKAKLEDDALKAQADRAIAKGYGIKDLTGSVQAPGNHGLPKTMPIEDYAVGQIKEKASKDITSAINSGQMQPGNAKAELDRRVALELQSHGVVDKETSGQIYGALNKQSILNAKDGTLSTEAIQAYETWLTLKTTPGITPAYLSKVVPDNDTRTLLETAFLNDSGTLNKANALMAAHTSLNDPSRDPNDKIKKDAAWQAGMDIDLPKALLERTHPSFLASLFNVNDRQERERIITSPIAQNYVELRAELYHQQNTNETAQVSREKAIADLQANSTPVMGNLIITKPGKELDKTMGVTGFGPTAAEDAIKGYLLKVAPEVWGKSYTDQMPSLLGGKPMLSGKDGYDRQSSIVNLAASVGNIDKQFSPQGIAKAISSGFESASDYKGSRADGPPMHITYNAEQGYITVDLYKDAARTQTLGAPKHFNVKAIGAQYVKEQTTPTGWAKTWNTVIKGATSGLHGDNMENVYNAN